MQHSESVNAPPPDYVPDLSKLPPLNIGSTRAGWESRRRALREAWLDYLGQGPRKVPLEGRIHGEEALGDVTRFRVSYQVEGGCRVEAYVICPVGEGPFPGMVVFHSTTPDTINCPAGLAGEPEKHFGLALARRGCVTLSLRNYLWDYREKSAAEAADFHEITACLLALWPEWTGMGKMLWDGMRAVDYLLTVPNVRRDRLGCIGHSLGAKEVFYLMAFDERVKVGVGSEAGLEIKSGNWDAPWYLGECIHERPDLEHHQLPALCAPRPLLAIGGGLTPSDRAEGVSAGEDSIQAWNVVEAARPAYELYGKGNHLGLYLHSKGHSVPPEAEQIIYDWFDRFL